MRHTLSLKCAVGSCSRSPSKDRSVTVSGVPSIFTIDAPIPDGNWRLRKMATDPADDRIHHTRGMSTATANTNRPDTSQSIIAKQHHKMILVNRTSGRQATDNPVTQITTERPEMLDHDPK